jgi:hypothetical protein
LWWSAGPMRKEAAHTSAPAARLLHRRWAPALRRAGTGMTDKELTRPAGVLSARQVPKMPLVEPPPRDSRSAHLCSCRRSTWCGPKSSSR